MGIEAVVPKCRTSRNAERRAANKGKIAKRRRSSLRKLIRDQEHAERERSAPGIFIIGEPAASEPAASAKRRKSSEDLTGRIARRAIREKACSHHPVANRACGSAS